MRKTWILGTLAILAPLVAQAVQLRYQLKVGDELRYQETLNAKGLLEIATALGQQSMAITVKAEEERSLKTVAAAGQDTWWLESRSLAGKATMTVEGQPQQQAVPGQNLRLRVNPLGDVLETQQLDSTERGGMDLDLRLDTLLSAARLASFPAGDLEVGATWDKEIPLRSANGQRQVSRASNKLLRLRTVDGREMAEIETRYDVPIPPTEGSVKFAGMALPVRIEGRSTGTSVTLWDLARGRSHLTTGTGQVALKLLLVGLSPEPADAKFDVDLKIALAGT